jgi:hypothetical protein
METQHYLLNRVDDIRNAQEDQNFTTANRLFEELLSLLNDEDITVDYNKSNDLAHIKSMIVQAISAQA